MEEREVAKEILSHGGLTFDKSLIRQNTIQNYINASNFFKKYRLNSPRTLDDLVKGYPTLRRFSDPYTDSITKLNPAKTNLKLNSLSSFYPLQNSPTFNLSKLSYLGLSLNNPYFHTMRETNLNQKSIILDEPNLNDNTENSKFLIILNDLKSLYTGSSFTEKTNKSRSEKLGVLMDYFSHSNEENDLRLDSKGCLVYKNLSTNTKFAIYVDYFLKYPNEVQSKSFPLYFRELFLDKISNSQVKFHPTIHFKPSKPSKSYLAMNSRKIKRRNKQR